MSGDVVFSYANEDTDEYAVPARGVNRYEAEKAIRADFLLADEPLEYLGIRVVRIALLLREAWERGRRSGLEECPDGYGVFV